VGRQPVKALLLDTHTWAWSLAGSDRLSKSALAAIGGADSVLVSPISFFEIAQKVRLGKWPEMEPFVDRLSALLEQQGGTIADFNPEICVMAGMMGWPHRDPFDRLLAALHGWSHSQSNPELKALARVAYRRQRELFADVARRWQAAGTLDPGADPDAMAELLQSVTLGFVAQRALAGDADVQAHVDALEALVGKTALRPGRPPRGRSGLAGGEPWPVRDKKDLEFSRTGSGASGGSARLLGDDLLAQRQALRADRRGSPGVLWRPA